MPTAERVRRRIVEPAIAHCYLDERHVWYVVPFAAEGPVPEGFELRRGEERDLEALAAIGGVGTRTACEYLARGAELYVVMHGDQLAFSSWIHVEAVPLAAARGGWLELPDGIVSFEDSIAAPDYRTTRVSSWAIDAITAGQAAKGVRSIITRIAEDNRVARKWARRLGSTEVAAMHRRRIGPRMRVWIDPLPGGEETAAMLAERLHARPTPTA
jgi:hypothetical protein